MTSKRDDAKQWHRRHFLQCMAWVGTGAVWTSGNADDTQPDEAGSSVSIDNFTFTPRTATVAAGTTVTWTNRDDIPHNVVSLEQKFKSPVLDTDGRFSSRFTETGTFKYFCSIHPKMRGEIVVR